MNLILMGAPGAGKGTQADIISKKYGIPAISTGDIIRGAIASATELGVLAKSYVDEGGLVPDEVVIGMVKEYIYSDSCKNGFILDGFPRSVGQAEALETLGISIDAVLLIEVDDEKIVSRMSGRRVCPGCGGSYHVQYNPPLKEGVCDRCSSRLITRSDDKAETVQKRLANYHALTEPLIRFYGERGLLLRAKGCEKLSDTTDNVLRALSKIRGDK